MQILYLRNVKISAKFAENLCISKRLAFKHEHLSDHLIVHQIDRKSETVKRLREKYGVFCEWRGKTAITCW